MVNLINAVNFFGKIIEWDSKKTAIWLIVIQAVIAVIAITLIIYLILHKWSKSQTTETVVVAAAAAQPTPQPEVIYVPEPKTEAERELTGISLDLGVVQREFTVGDKFGCDGLVINAEYNVSPTQETLVDYTLIEEETYERLTKKDKAHGVYVIKPTLYIVGKKVVTVKYGGQTAAYTISVNERDEDPYAYEEVEPIAAPVYDEKTRELLSISLNTDNVKKDYFVGDSLDHEGLVVLAHYNVEPLEEEVADYAVLPPDMGKKGKPTVTITYQGKTVGYQITVTPAPEEPKEEPQVVEQQPTVIVQRADPIILEEESISSKLRYDKSFTARLIQSEDEIKYLYTDLKNELISFKNVHARISWKRETFKCHKDVVAKFAYRGKQLCIFLPLNPNDYMDDNNHPVEDASDMSCYEDTPLMIRLKSKRRVKFARQLINTVMEKFGIPRVEHESVDFYLPYEGILELINKGLIKREIKSPEDEKIFDENAQANTEAKEDDTFALTEVAPGIYVTKKD
ncbi:MAG: bacterial Ig-like domain-containing protein [Clostridiales bacterium]|nr:bacterial Ig-like domain-containing protein [Clostridiales bacterium]